MQNKPLSVSIILLALVCTPIAFADEIVVSDADTICNLMLDNATDVGRLVGEPGVMVVKYADVIAYKPLENATGVGRLVGEPGVMVVKYADAFSYKSLENIPPVIRPIGELDVMVVRYADAISHEPLLSNATFVHHLAGDLNRDGVITSADAIIVLEMVARGEYDADADVNRDGSVTALDALMILQAAAGVIDL